MNDDELIKRGRKTGLTFEERLRQQKLINRARYKKQYKRKKLLLARRSRGKNP